MTAIEVARIFGVDVGSRRTKIKGGWLALCPVHGDSNPSLTIKEGRRCVLIRCRSHQCDLADICKAVGITVQSLWYDAEAKRDTASYLAARKRRREQEEANAAHCEAILHWSRETNRWERVAAILFTRMLTLGRSPQALHSAELWHKVLHVARMHRESLWSVQRASGVPRSKLGEVDCYILEAARESATRHTAAESQR